MSDAPLLWSALDPDEESPAVLLVVSDVSERATLSDLLSARHFRTIVPPNASLAAGRAKHADVAVIDFTAGGGAQGEACRLIRQRRPQLQIVGIVGGGDSLGIAAELALDDFVCRPYSNEEFVLRVGARARAGKAQRQQSSAAADQRALVALAAAGLFVIREGWFSYVNQEFARTFGYVEEEIAGAKTVHDLVVPDQRLAVGSRLQQLMETGAGSFSSAFRGLRKDGTAVDVQLSGARIPSDGRYVYGGTVVPQEQSAVRS